MTQPKPQFIKWEGPELALAVIQARLEQIRASLQPPRLGIIETAADEALVSVAQLQQWLASQPPGSAYFQHSHKRLPPTGGFITQQAQVSGKQAQIDRETDREDEVERREHKPNK